MADDAISKAVERLRVSTAELNKIGDQANLTIQRVERFLKQMGTGTHVWVSLDDNDDPEDSTFLEYRRVGGRFRLAYVIGGIPEREQVKALTECGRDIKLLCIGHVPQLLEKIAETIEGEIAKAKKAMGRVSRVLGSIPSTEE